MIVLNWHFLQFYLKYVEQSMSQVEYSGDKMRCINLIKEQFVTIREDIFAKNRVFFWNKVWQHVIFVKFV